MHRSARADDVEELLVKAEDRDSLLDPFKPCLHARLNAGCAHATGLAAEIRAQGYTGSTRTVIRYIQPFRWGVSQTSVTRPRIGLCGGQAPSVRTATGWLTRHPDTLDAHEQDQLARVLAGSDALATVHRHVKEFAEMLMLTRRRGGEDLEAGLADVQAHGALALRSIAAGSAGTTPP